MSDQLPKDYDVPHWFGRLDGKLDRIETKLDGHAETLARHDERIGRLESDVRDHLSGHLDDAGHKVTGRQAMWAAVAAALSTGAIGWVVNLLTAHH
jgi:hypothetical protein